MASGETGLLTRNPWVVRRPLTVAEYHRMGEVGILHEDDRVELIEGQLIAMSPIGSAHAGTSNILTRRLVQAIGDRGIVAVGNPVQLDDLSEPQPDFSVLKPRADDYRRATPRPDEVLLIVEVADSSLSYDRQRQTGAVCPASHPGVLDRQSCWRRGGDLPVAGGRAIRLDHPGCPRRSPGATVVAWRDDPGCGAVGLARATRRLRTAGRDGASSVSFE